MKETFKTVNSIKNKLVGCYEYTILTDFENEVYLNEHNRLDWFIGVTILLIAYL
jgi:hypothetical protein